MKIFIFEDKKVEAEKARAAVKTAGHEAIIVEGVLRLGMSDEEIIATAEYEVEPDGKPIEERSFEELLKRTRDRKYYSDPMNILYEDTRKSVDDINHALDEIVSLKERGENVGVITDMMFRFRAGNPRGMSAKGELTPSGFLIMAHAVAHGIPCCICTDCQGDPHGHHGKAVGFIRDGYLQSGRRRNSIFDLVATKEWDYAVKAVERRARGDE